MKLVSKKIPGKLFSKIMALTPICVVDVVLFNKDKTKVLLFKRQNKPLRGVYFSLGGRLFKNETFVQCAVRQAFREVGISVNKKKLFGGYFNEEIHKSSVFRGINYHDVVVYYGYQIDEGVKIRLDTQHDGHRWFPVSSKQIHPLVRIRIKKLLNE